ncbi:MAG: hypothetical protein ACK2UH_10740, partial [Candidatus Promineifilaceae bacterium]
MKSATTASLLAGRSPHHGDRRSLGRLAAKRQHAVNIGMRTRDDMDGNNLANALSAPGASYD